MLTFGNFCFCHRFQKSYYSLTTLCKTHLNNGESLKYAGVCCHCEGTFKLLGFVLPCFCLFAENVCSCSFYKGVTGNTQLNSQLSRIDFKAASMRLFLLTSNTWRSFFASYCSGFYSHRFTLWLILKKLFLSLSPSYIILLSFQGNKLQ